MNINNGSYELKVISLDEISNGKVLKQYDVGEDKIIGCYENEKFAIVFKNNTWNKLQIKISIDGTDILTSKLADTSEIGDMWSVAPYGTLELKAFPETNKGGAEFLFGKPSDSVAINTHGVKTGIGYIAAAVFVEKDVVNQSYWSKGVNPNEFQVLPYNPQFIPTTPWITPLEPWTTINDNTKFNEVKGFPVNINTTCTINVGKTMTASTLQAGYLKASEDIDSEPAVGAGDYVDQKITKVASLNKPILTSVINIKYEWWTSLRSKIRQGKEASKPINPAFPGDGTVKILDLKSTPKGKKDKKNKSKKYPELNRFE